MADKETAHQDNSLLDLKTDVAIIKQRVDIHDNAIVKLEDIVGDLDEDIQAMNRDLNNKMDAIHKDALTSVPAWAAKELKKSGLSTGVLITIIGILVTIVLALTIHSVHL